VFPPRRDFASLSAQDVLEARDAYHVALSAMPNVVATAIGRYLIHKDDWYATNPPDVPRPNGKGYVPANDPRTFTNSVVRPWSWPCVLVFVRQWVPRDEIGANAVPRRLYLPDGREVPTCVVLAPPDESEPPAARPPANSSGMLGGGYMAIRNGQGVEQIGTIACLVQRQGSFYALTNKHVAGADENPVLAVVGDSLETVGKPMGDGVTKRTLSSVFDGWPGDRTFVNIDAGLIRIDDVSRWTAQVFGIGEVGELFDATPESVTLDLIGCPVRAFGASSGPIEGEIRALFFRYESLGNYDYVSDLLIGPRGLELDAEAGRWVEPRPRGLDHRSHPETHPGDSGAIWFYDPPSEEAERGARARRLRPVAMQWGGVRIGAAGDRTALALATFLSTVCRVLDVEIVRDWSVGWSEYWGKIGHFAVGWKACESNLLEEASLKALMAANQERIGYGDDQLDQGAGFKQGRDGFVPLADVPDYVWVPSARYSGPRQHEPQQHFADVDLPPFGEPADSADFLARCVEDPSLVSPQAWSDFFAGFAEHGTGPEEGSLPFRVWQIFDALVDFARTGDTRSFVAAAGILAHYVGDASQPLHCSYLHHGQLPMMTVAGDDREYPVAHSSDEFKAYAKTAPAKVHGIYEEGMLEIAPAVLFANIERLLKQEPRRDVRRPDRREGADANTDVEIPDGHAAAVQTVLLMDRARKRLKPMDIIEADDPKLGPKPRAKKLWENAAIAEATAQSLADSTEVLARIWQAAWTVGRRNADGPIAAGALRELSEDELQTLYRSSTFLVPMTLAQMLKSGQFSEASRQDGKRPARTDGKGAARQPVP
jgi:hypothetical protein